MGYYVQLTDSTVRIPAAHLGRAFEALKRLNENDDLKTGLNAGERVFAGMPADYHKTAESALEILDLVGYECRYDKDLNLLIEYYDNKAMCEDVFVQALAPFIPDDQYLSWRGEDGSLYRFVFRDKKMYLYNSEVTCVDAGEYQPITVSMFSTSI